MIYEIEIIEPRAQRLLEELVNLNLIKFVQPKQKKVKKKVAEKAVPTHAEIMKGLKESAMEVNAAMRGEKKLRSAYDLLAELEAESKNNTLL